MIASIILATLSATAFSQDVIECSPADVMKTYWGADSGACTQGNTVHLYSAKDEMLGHYIKVEPGTFEEVDAAGKIVRTFSLAAAGENNVMQATLADGVWVVTHNETAEVLLKKPKCAKTESVGVDYVFNTEFNKAINFGSFTSTTFQNYVPCTSCSGTTSGACQNAGVKCRNVIAPQQCPNPTKFFPCSSSVTTIKNAMLISYQVHGWEYADPENTLRYTARMKVEDDDEVFSSNDDVVPDLDFAAMFEVPVTAEVENISGAISSVAIRTFIRKIGMSTYELTVESPATNIGDTLSIKTLL